MSTESPSELASHEPVAPGPDADHASSARRAAVAAFVGGTLEYYDFFLYVSASALVFNELFFPQVDGRLGQVLSMATIGIGYVVRPLAAVVIGHLGDRVSRKKMLLFTLLLMGISTTAIGLLPTAQQIGPAAAVLLVLLRVSQGISAAGESAGAATMALEHAPEGKRGFYTSFVNTGTVFGVMLSSLAFLLVSLLPREQFLAWGWRLPFLLSIVVAFIGLWIRRTLPEPEVFEQVLEEEEQTRTTWREWPLVVVFRQHWRRVLVGIGIYLVSVVSSIFSAFVLSYGVRSLHIAQPIMLGMNILTAFLGMCFQPIAGRIADRFGRKPVFMLGSVLSAGSIFFLLWSMGTGSIVLMYLGGISLMSISYGLVNALFPLLLGELFETEVRFSGAAITSQLALIVTGFAPAIAASIQGSGSQGWLPVATATAGACLVSAVVTGLFLKETYRTDTARLGREVAAR